MWRWKTKNNEALRILEEIINKIQDLSNWYVIQITGINRIRDIQTPPPPPPQWGRNNKEKKSNEL